MFRPTINSTPLTSQTAHIFFRNIGGESYHNDVTFISTLRALVASRINEGESVSVAFRNTSYSKSTIEDNPGNAVVNAIYNPYDYGDGSIVIHSFEGNASDNFAAFKVIEREFTSNNRGFERIEKVTEFFRKTFYSLCYVNPDDRKVVIFIDKMNIRRMHYLQCAIFAFLPWYFDPNAGVTEDEMELIQSLRETTPDRYMAAITKIASAYDFRSMHIRNSLKGFETLYDKRQCDSLRNNIQNYIRKIRDYNDQISNVLRNKNDAEIRLMGLEEKIARLEGEDSEIMEQITNDIQYKDLPHLRQDFQKLEDKYRANKQFSDMYVKFVFSGILKELLDQMDEMDEKMLSKRVDRLYRCKNLKDVIAIVDEALQEYEHCIQEQEDGFRSEITKVKSYIYHHYQERNLGAETLSAMVFLSPGYLSAVFKEETGVTLNRFIREVRMEKAKELLETTNMKISGIAKEVGFSNNSYFCRSFREFFGDTPEACRKGTEADEKTNTEAAPSI